MNNQQHPVLPEEPWWCGRIVPVTTVKGSRLVWYYESRNGCGQLNRPSRNSCWNCGKARRART